MAQHLAIEASPSAISFTVLNGENVSDNILIQLEGRNDTDRKQHLSDEMKQHFALGREFEEVTLSWSHAKSTLIPSFVLNDSSAKEVFHLCFGKSEFEVDYNRIAEQSLVNVYEIPTWIKSFFVLKYPRIVLQHTGSHTVRKTMDKNAFDLKISALLFDGYFLLTMVKHNKLEFYSFFEYQTAEDLLYHLSFVLQQKELMNDKGSIELIKGINANDSHLSSFKELKEKVKDLSQLKVVDAPDFIAKSQLLCV